MSDTGDTNDPLGIGQYDWSTQDAWSQGAWSPGSLVRRGVRGWRVGCFRYFRHTRFFGFRQQPVRGARPVSDERTRATLKRAAATAATFEACHD
jgi:hypothetical protein